MAGNVFLSPRAIKRQILTQIPILYEFFYEVGGGAILL